MTGTPLYMAPEKLLGRDEFDEVRCDVYSMGVTLYETATLALPFAIPKGLPKSQWASYLTASDPPRPRALNPQLPEALEAIILKAIDPNPERRYPSARELADDLDRLG